MVENAVRDVVIVGSGPAGLTAAIYAARARLEPLMLEGSVTAGGALMNTTDVENYPGFPEGVAGPELMELFQKQAERFGAKVVFEDATAIDFSRRPFTLKSLSGQKVEAHAVIIATGARANYLGLPSEELYKNRGVSACAVCDGALPRFRNKPLVVVGGGDSAVHSSVFAFQGFLPAFFPRRRLETTL